MYNVYEDVLLMNQFYNADMNCCISIFTPCNSTLYDDYTDFIGEDRYMQIDLNGGKFIIDKFAVNGLTIQITITRYILNGVIYYL